MKRIYIIIITLATVMLASCEKQLDLQPHNSIGNEKVFEKVDDLLTAKIGVYGNMASLASISYSSRASDDLKLIAENTGQGVSIHNWTYNASDADIETLWDGAYKSIDLANRVLAAAEVFLADPDVSADDLKIIKDVKGHCLFVRAHSHFEIIRAYSPAYSDGAIGIPYMTEAAVSGKPSRLSSLEVYTNIKNDLTASISLLPKGADASVEFASVSAANALMARVLLWQGDYDNAIVYADKVISESGISLASRGQIEALWKDEIPSGVEVIFQLNKVDGDTEIGSIFNRTGNDDIFFQPSVDLRSQYGANDIRANVYFGTLNGKDIVNKHIGRTGGQKNLVHVKMYRLSEMYLIKAEAYANKGDLVNAANFVYEIQSRRDTDITSAPVYSSKSAAIDGVLLEKRREMAYEGHRFYDLKRYNKGIVRIGLDAELASGKTLAAGDYRFVFPIPQAEMFANENMVQNANY